MLTGQLQPDLMDSIRLTEILLINRLCHPLELAGVV